MKSMLPPAIMDQVVETELYINTSSEFSAGKIAQEVAEIEENKDLERKLTKKSDTNSNNSDLGSRAFKDGDKVYPYALKDSNEFV